MNITLNNEKISTNKITCKGKIKIIEHHNIKYVFKTNNRCNNNNIYDYLESRNFKYYPKIIEQNNNYTISEYQEEYDIPIEQKILDLIDLVSLLHSKTVQYKSVTEDIYKEIYEKLENQINDIYIMLNEKITLIETKIFMSPSEYLLARNISKLYGSLMYSKNLLDKWYELVKNKKQIRKVLVHNNLKIEHFIKNKSSYLINWDKSDIDMPIIDLYQLYINHNLEFDFENLISHYEKKFPLLKEEKMLFMVLISIPILHETNDKEYRNCLYITKYIDSINNSENIILKYNSK